MISLAINVYISNFQIRQSTIGIMSLTTGLCAFLLLISSSSAEIFNKSWWNNTVFYQISMRSFYDSNGDGTGDLKGITSKLHYIADTGINVIRLSAIYESPMTFFGSDVSNFTNVNPIFGTMDDFKALLAEAHKLGLKVALDFVPNHTSDKNPWFQKALQGDKKYMGYYMWAEGKNKDNITPPNNWISVYGGPAWTYVESVQKWYYHQFSNEQPDLNYSNPDVVQEIRDKMYFWLDTGIDGVTLYHIRYLFEDKDLRDEPRSYAAGAKPEDYNYLEHIYTRDQLATYETVGTFKKFVDEYVDERNLDQKLYALEVDTDLTHIIKYFDYNAMSLNFQFIKNVTVNSSADHVKKQIDLFRNSLPSGEIANWALGTRDNPRVATRFPERLDQMHMLSMILPGIAVSYYGDEIGMIDDNHITWAETQDPKARKVGKEHYAAVSRDPERTPFQWNAEKNAGFSTADSTWLPVNPNYKQLNLEKQTSSHESHYKIYKTLAHMHHNEPALTKGSYISFTTNNGTVLGVIRSTGSRTVLLLINFGDHNSQTVDLSGQDLPETMNLNIASLGSQSSLKQQVDIKKIHLPEKAAVVYTSF